MSMNNKQTEGKGEQNRKKGKIVKRFELEITSNKRSTSGFHIYPEHERIIHAFARLNPSINNKGESLEYIVNSFLAGLQPDKREALLKYAAGEHDEDQW